MSQLKAFEESPLVTRAVLKNGLTVLVNEFHAVPLVGLSCYVNTGYAHDAPGLAGMARLVQRMLLSRIEPGGGGRILREDVRALGGELQGFTDAQKSAYFITVPSAQWKKAVDHMGQLLLSPAWNEERLKQQIALLREEEKIKPSTPAVKARHSLLELALGREQYAAWNPDWLNSPAEFNLESVKKHYAAEYVAPAITIVVSGDVLSSEIITEIIKIFAKISSAARQRSASRAADRGGFKYEQVRGVGSRPRILAGFKLPAAGSPDYPAIEVLRTILATGERSVLARRLRNEKKAIQRIFSDLIPYPGGSIFLLDMELEPESIDRCEIALFAEIEILKHEEPGVEEMERAYAQMEVAHWAELQTVAQRVEKLWFFEAHGGWRGMQSFPSSIRKVKSSDVGKAAKKYLHLDNCAILEYLPEEVESRNMTRETFQEIIKALLEESTREELEKRNKETKPAYSIPEARPAVSLSEIRYPFRKASILRGPELYIREDRTLPIVQIGFFFPGGRLGETAGNRRITDLMLRCLFRNTKVEEKADPMMQLEIYGGMLRPVFEQDYFGAYLTVLSHHVEHALDIILRIIKFPGFEEEEVARQKVILTGDLRSAADSNEDYEARRLKRMLFGTHSYAIDAEEAVEAVPEINLTAVQDWYKQTIEDRRPIVVITGDTRGTSLASYFVRNFSGSRYRDAELPEEHPQLPAEPKQAAEEWKKPHGVVALAFFLPPWGDEDLYPIALVEDHLKSSAGLLNVVDSGTENDAALIVTFRLQSWLRGGVLAVTAYPAPGSEQRVLESLRQVMANLADKRILYRDFRSALSAVEGNFWIRQQSRETQAAELVMNVLAGLGLEEMQDYPSRLREVTEDDFQEAAMRFLKPAKAVELILRGSQKTGPPQ